MVVVFGVYVGLNFEDEVGEFWIIDRYFVGGGWLWCVGDGDGDGFVWCGWDGVFEEIVEEELDVEVVYGGVEIDGCLLVVLDGIEIEWVVGVVEYFELFFDLFEGVVVEFFVDEGIVEIGDVDGSLEFIVGDVFEEVNFFGVVVENVFEGWVVVERLDDWG